MGTKPIASLLATMAIPMMLSMLVQALYNVVDSVFVARISESQLELTAVSVAFPIQNLMIAFGTGIGVGFTALISRSLGARDPKTAGKAAAHGMMIEGLSYLLFLAVGLFFVRPFFESQTSNPLIVEYGCQYLSVCCVFSFGLFSQFIFEKALQSTGKTVYSMISQGVGAIVNIILDPIMIFGLFGMPEMGVTGAAAATVIGQMCGALVGAVLHFRRNRELRVELSSFRPEGAIFGRILLVGLPSTIMVAIGSLMNYCMNRILFTVDRVGETAATVFGVYFKLQSFAVMPVFGLNNGMVPIVAYNYGARNSERITKTVKLSVLWAVIIMAVAIGVFQLVPDKLLAMFGAGEDMMEIGVTALRIISLNFVFAGYCIVISSVFQALGNGLYSMAVSFIRQIVVLIPVAYLFARMGNLDMIWFSFPIAECASVVVCTVLYIIIYRKKIRPLGQSDKE